MQRYFSSKKNGDRFSINEEDLYHINKVMRMKDGDLIEIVYESEAYVASLSGKEATMIEKINSDVKKTNITICIPLLSDSKMSFVLQKVTEMGVDRIIPINTARSVVKLTDVTKKYNRWNKICKEASEQSKRVSVPVIEPITNIKQLNIPGLKFICSTVNKENKLKNYLKDVDDVTFLIGPEGGLTKEEEQTLIDLHFIPITLGKTVLRVETVPIVLLGILNYEMME